MGENLSRRFATMSEEERRRYALEQERAAEAGETDEADQELEFGEPRHDPGLTKANLEDKDGTGALVDEEEHARRVREQARNRSREGRERP
ncbi:MAG TPA: hypothetical protein VH764_01095 [Gemmatimonadales bacterium]